MPEMAELFHEVERVSRLRLPPSEALMQLLKFRGDEETPEGAQLLTLPLNEAIADAQHWLNAVLIAEPPPRLEVLWFGLFNTDEGDGTEPLNLYMNGASKWDDLEPDLDCTPEGRCLPTGILQRLAQISGNDDYDVGLLIATILVRHALEALTPTALAQIASSCAVYVGFDSGDYIHLGALDRTGFTVLT